MVKVVWILLLMPTYKKLNSGHYVTTLESLKRFCAKTKTPLDWIQTTPERDYPFRVSVPREVWVAYVQRTARDIDYNDFKSHCKALTGYGMAEAGLTSQQLMAMGMVWAVMYDDWAERP